jgi:glycosyltransferase involved in cell wall biosynthesis
VQHRTRVGVVYPLPVPYHDRLFDLVSSEPGVDLTVLFCRKRQPGRDWGPRTVAYRHRFLRNYGFARQGRTLFSFHLNPGVVAALAGGHFDVVVVTGLNHPTMLLTVLYCLLTRTPYLVWNESHHHRRRPPSAPKRLAKSVLYRPVLGASAGCLVTGTYARDYVVSYGCPPERTFVVANTADVARLAEQVEAARAGVAAHKAQLGVSDKLVVLYVGRLSPEKGPGDLLDAFATLRQDVPDAALVLVGDGPLRPLLERSCRERGFDGVVFEGFKEPAELPRYYALADVVVVPSTSETWGTVVNEALVAGLPVVATRVVGAVGDLVVDGDNGVVVPEADPCALARGLHQVLGDDGLRRSMGERSRQVVAPWTQEASAKAFQRAVVAACGGAALAVSGGP